MRRVASLCLLLVSSVAFGAVEFDPTGVLATGWTATGVDESAGDLWTIGGKSADGKFLVIVAGAHDVGVANGEGYQPQVGASPLVVLDGQALPNARVEGTFSISHAMVQSPIQSMADPADPSKYLFASGIADEVPVQYAFDYSVFESDTAIDAAYRIAGSGRGTGKLTFETTAPDNSNVALASANYSLTVVPEPSSRIAWLLLIAVGLFAAKIQFRR